MKTTRKVASQGSAAGEQQLAGFIDKFDAKNAVLIRSVREALRRRLPTANELVYDNYNFFVIGYCPTERPSDCIVSIAAAANGVGLSFYFKQEIELAQQRVMIHLLVPLLLVALPKPLGKSPEFLRR